VIGVDKNIGTFSRAALRSDTQANRATAISLADASAGAAVEKVRVPVGTSTTAAVWGSRSALIIIRLEVLKDIISGEGNPRLLYTIHGVDHRWSSQCRPQSSIQEVVRGTKI
jgi:hypothetical protein